MKKLCIAVATPYWYQNDSFLPILTGCSCARTKTKTNPKTTVSFVLDKACDE